MSDVFIAGACSTRFKKWPDRDFRDLSREAVAGALTDAGLESGGEVEGAWFGNCAMGVWGQDNIRGQVALTPMMREGALNERLPITNVEGGCATGSAALNGAFMAIASGQADLVLALGVEKVFVPDDPVKTFGLFLGGVDQRHPQEWETFLAEAGERGGQTFAPHPHRVMFLDVHAMQARQHMATYGTTKAQLATIASKNHHHGSLNPLAQYRFTVTPEAVLEDRPVVEPFTRGMCSPLSDGAAAVLLCSRRWLEGRSDTSAKDRAIRLRTSILMGGAWRELGEDSVTRHAATKAYDKSGLGPADVDIAELHDSTAFCELYAAEALGFCETGEGGAYAESGATAIGGERPLNTSGGLESKGHPLGATGLGMIDELVCQLRGEAGERQAGAPTVGLQQNAGGLIGFDEALCSVAILERDR